MTKTRLTKVIRRNRSRLFVDAFFVLAIALGIGTAAAAVIGQASMAATTPTQVIDERVADANECQPSRSTVALYC